MKKTPRGQRRLIQLDSFQSTYSADLTSLLVPGALGDRGKAMSQTVYGTGTDLYTSSTAVEGAVPGATPRGFVVFLRLVSPHDRAEVELVVNDMIKRLAAVVPDAKANRTYGFVDPEFVQARPLSADRPLLERLRADYIAMRAARTSGIVPDAGGGGGAPGGRGSGEFPSDGPNDRVAPTGGGGTADDIEAMKDRLTGEDMSKDKVVEVIFLVVLNPTPVDPNAPVVEGEPAAPAARPAPAAPAAPARGEILP